MTEISQDEPGLGIAAPRRLAAAGGERCYVRFAEIGDRGARRVRTAESRGWPALVVALLASTHDVSRCDASLTRATAYDVRRVQLRVAVAHRPHLVALDLGACGARWTSEEPAQAAKHLAHCAQVLSARGAVVVTTYAGRGARCRGDRTAIEAVYEDLARRFGHIHLDRSAGIASFVEQFADAAAERSLYVPRAWPIR
jgi:hypothetical protein